METYVDRIMLKRPTLENLQISRTTATTNIAAGVSSGNGSGYSMIQNYQELKNPLKELFKPSSSRSKKCLTQISPDLDMRNNSKNVIKSSRLFAEISEYNSPILPLETNKTPTNIKLKTPQPITFEQTCCKISNFFDKNQVQNSILKLNSTEQRIKIVDFIIQRRDELQNLAAEVALHKAAPVIKGFREKFKHPKLSNNNARWFVNNSRNTPLGTFVLKSPSQIAKYKEYDSPKNYNTNNACPNPSNNIPGFDSLTSTSEITLRRGTNDTNKDLECAEIAKDDFESNNNSRNNEEADDNLEDDEEIFEEQQQQQIINKDMRIQTNTRQIDYENDNRIKIYPIKSLSIEQIDNSLRSLSNSPKNRNNMVLNQAFKKPFDRSNSTQIDLNIPDQPQSNELRKKLKIIWALDNEHKYAQSLIRKNFREADSIPEYLHAFTRQPGPIQKKNQEEKYNKFAQKKLEKDLIKYSLKNEDELIINALNTSNQRLKQIEKKARQKFEVYQSHPEFQANLSRKTSKQNTEIDNMKVKQFLKHLDSQPLFGKNDTPLNKLLSDESPKKGKLIKKIDGNLLKGFKGLRRLIVKTPTQKPSNSIKKPKYHFLTVMANDPCTPSPESKPEFSPRVTFNKKLLYETNNLQTTPLPNLHEDKSNMKIKKQSSLKQKEIDGLHDTKKHSDIKKNLMFV